MIVRVNKAGMLTTVQDRGRWGYQAMGVPVAGPMDSYSHRLANLLVGNDVIIYAQSNTGLTYKLGYTFGVNACGAIFFGFFFWRLNRWRKRMK